MVKHRVSFCRPLASIIAWVSVTPARVIFINLTVPLLLKALWWLLVFRIEFQHALTRDLSWSGPSCLLFQPHRFHVCLTLSPYWTLRWVVVSCHAFAWSALSLLSKWHGLKHYSLPALPPSLAGRHAQKTFMKSFSLFVSILLSPELYSVHSWRVLIMRCTAWNTKKIHFTLWRNQNTNI